MTVSPWIILGVVGYVVLEWFTASWLASIIGWPGVFLTVAVLVLVGAAVMRRAGFAAARSLRATTVDGVNVSQSLTQERAGQVTREVGDAGSLFVAGLLIAIPGLVTSAVGLLLLITPLRRAVSGAVTRSLRRRAQASGLIVTSTTTTVAGTVVRDDEPRPVRGEIVEGTVVERDDERGPSAG
ncbi:MAG: FxsA family protein [Candidatus Nanopelagicales bacterium]